jgi:FkbM family methyltransferase
MKKIIKLYNILSRKELFIALYSKKIAAATEHKFLFQKNYYNSLIDIGANKGQFSLIAKNINPNLTIYAFEPLSTPANKFETLFRGNSNITLHKVAISDTEGESIIHVSQKEDSSSLLPIGKLQNQIFPGTKESHTETIITKRLDSVLSKDQITAPALLKLDVQGFELQALRGCETLLDCFEHIYVECSFVELYEGQSLAHEVIAFLQERNFKLKGIYNTYYDKDGIAIQADFLFAHS